MKILVVSYDMLMPDVYLRMAKDGHDVIVACSNGDKTLDGSVVKVPFNKRKYLYNLVDMIIFDDSNFGDEPKDLRSSGKIVIGGSKEIDKLELDRIFANEKAKGVGIKVPEIHKIESLKEAAKFVKQHPARWVLKQQGKLDVIKGLNYVGKMEDGTDMIDHIGWMDELWVSNLKQDFVLQEYIEGHEFAVGAYWDGNSFMKDENGDEVCEENFEHKALFPGDRGESTGEMFTLMRYTKAKDSKLFKETLDKCRNMLIEMDYRGCIDINCKINEKGVYFLEFTPRFGVPATSAQTAIQETKWADMFYACAKGEQIKGGLIYNPDWCIVAWLYTKPFPSSLGKKYAKMIEDLYKNKDPESIDEQKQLLESRLAVSMGVIVNFNEKPTKEDWKNIHFDGVYYENGKLKVGNRDGYIVTITGMGKTPLEAGENTEKLLKKFVVSKSFFRNDWCSHYDEARDDLKSWGYL